VGFRWLPKRKGESSAMMLLPLLMLIFGLDPYLTRAHIMETTTTSRHMSRLAMIGGNLKYGYGVSTVENSTSTLPYSHIALHHLPRGAPYCGLAFTKVGTIRLVCSSTRTRAQHFQVMTSAVPPHSKGLSREPKEWVSYR